MTSYWEEDSVRFSHTHDDGRKCFEARGTHRPKDIGVVMLRGRQCLVGYVQYTGRWHAYDYHTGERLADFSNRFYEEFVRQLRVYTLRDDPRCVAHSE